jgi:hypothetical protein
MCFNSSFDQMKSEGCLSQKMALHITEIYEYAGKPKLGGLMDPRQGVIIILINVTSTGSE